MSHFPLYHTSLEANAEMSADWYTVGLRIGLAPTLWG